MDTLKTAIFSNNLSLWSITSIGITDIIDILIVAYLVYKVVTWIQETRAWSLFKGIVIILLAMMASNIFHLNTLYWIINKTFNVGLIALIVLFQPELRKALEQIGKGKMVRVFSGSTQDYLVSERTVLEIITAAKAMARARTGAIIALEREVPLGDHEKTGIPIDAAVSSQLLINIFEDKTPLHDGAVIIRSNRIAAACCILPLTQEQVSMELGTRHRASIGISEVSDSKVLVVSEETGYISIAYMGKLYRNLDENEILDMLLQKHDNEKKMWFFGKDGENNEETR